MSIRILLLLLLSYFSLRNTAISRAVELTSAAHSIRARRLKRRNPMAILKRCTLVHDNITVDVIKRPGHGNRCVTRLGSTSAHTKVAHYNVMVRGKIYGNNSYGTQYDDNILNVF